MQIDHQFDQASGRVRAVERELYGAIVIAERPADVDPEVASRLLAGAYHAQGWSVTDIVLFRRLRFAGLPLDVDALLAAAAAGRYAIDQVDLGAALDWAVARDLDRLAPETLVVPSGRTTRLQYQEDGAVIASVKLQELFGLADTPRVGTRREPVVFELLAPNGRPVQTTRDLRSFWNTTYQEVARSSVAATRVIPGPKTPGPPHRPLEPGRDRPAREEGRRMRKRTDLKNEATKLTEANEGPGRSSSPANGRR